MKNIKNFIREHYLIGILGLLLALLVLSPVIAFPIVAKESYQGINIPHFGTDSHGYLTRAKEVLEGNRLGNPVLREGKEADDYYFNVNEYILVAPFRILGLADTINIVTIYNTYNFIGVFALILLIYFLVFRLSRDKLLATVTALFVIGGYSIIFHKALFYTDFNIYGRSMFPLISSLAFFSYLLLLVKSLQSPNSRHNIFAGALFGLLFYVYFYAWTFALALNAILLFLYFLRRERWLAKKILIISGIGILIGLYNIVRIFLFMNSPAGEQFSYFSWSYRSHSPVIANLSIAVLLAYAFFKYYKRNDENGPLLLALILAGWVALNQQIITGQLIQHNHYYWFFIIPTSIIVGLYMFWAFLPKRQYRNVLLVVLVGIVFINTAGGQYKSFWTTFESKLYEQNYQPILNALNRIDKPDVVLAVNGSLSYLVTIYTPHDIFWHSFATLNDNELQRFRDTLYVYLFFNKEARDDFSGYLNKVMSDNQHASIYKDSYKNIEGYQSGFYFYDYNDRLTRGDSLILKKREQILPVLAAEYEALAKNPRNIEGLLKQYGVNYIIWDKNRHPEWDLSFISNLQEVISNDNIYLYKIGS